MSAISADAVKKLRDRTNLPMMDCKTALTEAGGDMEKAVDILRQRFKGVADKRAGREAGEGRIAAFVDEAKQVGAIVEVRCESPMVVKADAFIALAKELAEHVAATDPKSVDEMLCQPFSGDVSKNVQDRINEAIGLIRENMKIARFVRLTGNLGEYVHHDGSVGVLLQVNGKADKQLLRDVCMHIVAVVPTPAAVRREDVSAEIVAKEREIAKGQIAGDPKNAGKPANILDKIAEGKLNAWYKDNVLVEQPFVKDDSRSVGQVLKSGGVEPTKFIRMKVGEVAN
jgi:elongation factor Ts